MTTGGVTSTGRHQGLSDSTYGAATGQTLFYNRSRKFLACIVTIMLDIRDVDQQYAKG